MAVTLLDSVPVDQITEQARQVRFSRTVLTLVAWLLIGIGKVAGYMWLVPVWCCLAIREGWREVHPPKVSNGRAGTR